MDMPDRLGAENSSVSEHDVPKDREIQSTLDTHLYELWRAKGLSLNERWKPEQQAEQVKAIEDLKISYALIDPSNRPPKLGDRWPQRTEQAQQTLDQLAKPQDWQTKSDAAKNVENMIGAFPQKMQDFIKAFLELFGMKFSDKKNDQEATKDFSKLLAKWISADALKNFNLDKVDNIDWTTDLQFNKEATIKWNKKPAETNPPANPIPAGKPIEVKDGKIVLAKGTQITTIDDKVGWPLTITVLNADKTTDTYTITNAKKIEPASAEPAKPTPTVEAAVVPPVVEEKPAE